MMDNKEIKQVIKNFVNFDIENDYYQKEDKEELVRLFKKILYEDDVTIRKFLQAFFNQTKKLAGEYSLLAKEQDVEEVPSEIEEPIEEVPEEVEEPKEPETQEESLRKFYISKAADILYD